MAVTEVCLNHVAFKQWLQSEADDGDQIDSGHLKKAVTIALQDNVTAIQRSYILHYFVDSLTIYQIGEMYGVNASTVSRGINRGLKNLFKALRLISPRFYNLEFINMDLRIRGNYHEQG